MSHKSWFGEWVEDRLSSKRNFLMGVTGETGVGKSFMALYLADKYDGNNDFNEDHIVFTAKEFLDCVKNLGDNCFIVVDEAGLMYSHRDFATNVNKLLSFVMQSFRYKFLNVIFTMPSLGFMDYVGRSLLHAVIRVKDRGYGRVYRVSKDTLGRRIFYKTIGELKVPLPEKRLIDLYEAKKDRIMSERYEAYRSELEGEEFSLRSATPIDIVKHVRESGDSDFKDEKGRFDAGLMAGLLDINLNKAYIVKKLLEKGVLKPS